MFTCCSSLLVGLGYLHAGEINIVTVPIKSPLPLSRTLPVLGNRVQTSLSATMPPIKIGGESAAVREPMPRLQRAKKIGVWILVCVGRVRGRLCVCVCVCVVCVCCLLYTSPSPRDRGISRMTSSA